MCSYITYTQTSTYEQQQKWVDSRAYHPHIEISIQSIILVHMTCFKTIISNLFWIRHLVDGYYICVCRIEESDSKSTRTREAKQRVLQNTIRSLFAAYACVFSVETCAALCHDFCITVALNCDAMLYLCSLHMHIITSTIARAHMQNQPAWHEGKSDASVPLYVCGPNQIICSCSSSSIAEMLAFFASVFISFFFFSMAAVALLVAEHQQCSVAICIQIYTPTSIHIFAAALQFLINWKNSSSIFCCCYLLSPLIISDGGYS